MHLVMPLVVVLACAACGTSSNERSDSAQAPPGERTVFHYHVVTTLGGAEKDRHDEVWTLRERLSEGREAAAQGREADRQNVLVEGAPPSGATTRFFPRPVPRVYIEQAPPANGIGCVPQFQDEGEETLGGKARHVIHLGCMWGIIDNGGARAESWIDGMPVPVRLEETSGGGMVGSRVVTYTLDAAELP